MNLNLPDSLSKLLVLIGIILIGFYVLSSVEMEKEYMEVFKGLDKVQDSIELMKVKRRIMLESLVEKAKDSSEKYNIDIPITQTDTTATFVITYSGNPSQVLVSKSLHPLWLDYVEAGEQIDIAEAKLEIEKENHTAAIENRNWEQTNNYIPLGIFGTILLTIGGIWWYEENKRKNFKKIDDVFYEYCQSCCKKFSAMVLYGRNKDKSENFAFCKGCFDKGKFKEPDLTKEILIERIEKDENLSAKKKKKIKLRVDELLRWKKHHY